VGRIVEADNLAVLRTLPDGFANLIYIDPPFNTGTIQRRTQLETTLDPDGGDRTGFQGRRFASRTVGTTSFEDRFDDYLGFLEPRLREARRILAPDGSFFLHIDFREVHYCKVLLDTIFGRDCFLNEIIWAYDYGARSKRRWSPKHDNLLWYVADPENYVYQYDAIDRIPYLAPGLVGPEKAARGKTPTDVWWHTIVSPTGREKTGYATQKPLGILERIVRVHSRQGDMLVDFFAGSGSFGEAAARHDRDFLLIDQNPDAVRIMRARLDTYLNESADTQPTSDPDTSPRGDLERTEELACEPPMTRGRP